MSTNHGETAQQVTELFTRAVESGALRAEDVTRGYDAADHQDGDLLNDNASPLTLATRAYEQYFASDKTAHQASLLIGRLLRYAEVYPSIEQGETV